MDLALKQMQLYKELLEKHGVEVSVIKIIREDKMQSGRKPLESEAEYKARREEFLANIYISLATIATCQHDLKTTMETLDDEYSLNMDLEWGFIFTNLEDVSDKIINYVKATLG